MKRLVAGRLFGSASAVLLLCACVARGQQYSITTIAGGAPPATPVSATGISIGQPRRLAVDSSGNVYFTSGNCVFEIAAAGSLVLVAGTSRPGFSGDNGPAVNAQLNLPVGLAVDSSGNVYIADSLNNRIRVVNSSGIISTIAGNGAIGYPGAVGDAGQATQAQLYLPGGVAVDNNGNVYIADTGHSLIREVTTDGNINSIAGNGYAGYSGDSLPPLTGQVNKPQDVALDSSGNVYIADTGNSAIRIIYGPKTTVVNATGGSLAGMLNTFAGTAGTVGYLGDSGIAYQASLTSPSSVAVDPSGNVYFTQPYDGTIRQVNANGIINTIVGLDVLGFSGDGGIASKALLNTPMGVATDSQGNLYIADTNNNRIRKVVGFAGNIATYAGNGVLSYSGDGGAATKAQFNTPQGVAVDSGGNYYVADSANNVVRKVTAGGVVSNFAGNGSGGFGGDNGAATGAQLNSPHGVAVDSAGNVYIADTGNSRIRKVSGGVIGTIAGSGTVGYSGDGGAGPSAQLNSPTGVAVDSAGNVYIADFGNNVIRKLSAGGAISTVAGNTRQGYSGDGGGGTQAQLNGPQGVGVDSAGNVYIADTLNNRVRKLSGGNIQTVAGIGIPGNSGDGGPAASAQLAAPTGLAVDSAGSIYVSNGSSNVRKIFPNGPISTIAGTNALGYSGDGGPALNATFNGALGLAVDSAGNVYVADSGNNAIRQLQPLATGTGISAVVNGAGNQTGSIAPGEIVVLYGNGLGPSAVVTNQPNSNGVYSTAIGGTAVYVGGTAAPILYASATQVSAIVPFGVTGSTAPVYVTYQGIATTPVSVPVATAAPALFTTDFSGKGQVAAVNQGSTPTVNSASHPANAGTFVQLYATGGGATSPSSTDGAIATGPAQLAQTATVSIGGKNATVAYAGAAPGSPNGVVQINVQIPSGLPAGQAEVLVQIGGVSSPTGATIAVSGN
ncbi:MAG: hypothetical protein P4L56_09125 [Candidatus Sulfopaludibacter sp.]|nr:hypothetical protein [Candidatus Sulfopaludibacter sp.]